MFNEYLKAMSVILPVALATAGLEIVRVLRMPRTTGSSVFGAAAGYLIGALIFGWIAILVYRWTGTRWPENPGQIYFWLAAGSTVLFTVLAFIMPLAFKSPWLDAVIWTGMNILWGAGFGWFLPQVLGKIALPA